MRKKVSLSVLLIMLMTAVFPQTATAEVLTEGLPQIDAASYIVIEGSTGEVLFGKDYTAQADPVGLVKMMTAVLAIENGDMEKIITIGDIPSEKIQGTRTVMLRKAEKLKLGYLVQAIVIESANDAAYVVADAIGANENKFVDMMNEKAKSLGMNNTVFTNVYGLTDANQLTTAEDMAVLGRYAMSIGAYRDMAGTKSFQWPGETYNGQILSNTNPLLEIMPEATGVKAGYVKEYGEDGKEYANLVGAAQKDGRELIGVILGGSSESTIGTDMQTILNYGFEQTKVVPVVQKEAAMTNIAYGDKKEIRVVAGESYSLVRPADNNAIVEMQMTLNDISLPIKKDQKVGVLTIFSDGATIGEVPLVSMDDARGSINWLFIITAIMTILYLAQIILRTYRMLRKSYYNARSAEPQQRSGGNGRREAAGQENTSSKRKSLSDRSNRPLDR